MQREHETFLRDELAERIASILGHSETGLFT